MTMTPYKDISGRSGVKGYEAGNDFIRIRFKEGSVYCYDHSAPGPEHVKEMQRLARFGKGLSAYISQHVKKNFAEKEC